MESTNSARIELTVNGRGESMEVEHRDSLLDVLRERLGLTGAKRACDRGECGACAVLVDGRPMLSCLALPIELVGRKILTVEGLADRGRLHPLQQAFAELGAAQCGYCTPGILVTAKALLDETLNPSRQEIREALAGNLCRCTGYTKILDSVELAARRMRADGPAPPGARPEARVGGLVEVEDTAQPGGVILGMPR